eukprot:c37614_g1_i1 orf=64-216(-)
MLLDHLNYNAQHLPLLTSLTTCLGHIVMGDTMIEGVQVSKIQSCTVENFI